MVLGLGFVLFRPEEKPALAWDGFEVGPVRPTKPLHLVWGEGYEVLVVVLALGGVGVPLLELHGRVWRHRLL